MKKIIFIGSLFISVGLYSQTVKVSTDKKIKIEESNTPNAKVSPEKNNEGVQKVISADKGANNSMPESIDTNTTGTVSNKRINEVSTEKND